MSYAIAWCFLIIHVIMFFLYIAYDVRPMIYFNIFSMLFYLRAFYLIHKNRLYEYVVTTYLEVVIHMCFATYFTGWENGFQITLIGLSILIFFSEYVGRMIKTRHVHAAYLCIFGMSAYIITLFLDQLHEAAYPLPVSISFALQFSWALIVFIITIAFLQIFVLVTFQSEKFLSRKAGQDELTGLFNRFTVNNRLDEIIRSDSAKESWISIIDIDDFKKINDTYGHNYGDYVLSTLAEIMRESLTEELCFRWGGEEFLIVGTGRDKAYQKLDDFRKNVEGYEFDYEGVKLHLTITGGIAFYEDGLSKEQWVNSADIRLYEGKRNGKNKIVV